MMTEIKSTWQSFEEPPPHIASPHDSSTNDHDHNNDTKKLFLVPSSISRLFRTKPEPTHN